MKKEKQKTTEKTKEIKEEKRKEKDKKKKNKKYEKSLKIIIITLAAVLIFSLLIFYLTKKPEETEFQWNGIDFQKITIGEIIFYNTTINSIQEGKITKYIIYLRKDPRKIGERVKLQGEFNLRQNIQIKIADSFDCDGDQTIAFANFAYVHGIMGANVKAEENSTCNEQGKFTYIEIKKGEKTEIIQTSQDCYEIIIKDCDVLAGTERFILESLKKIKEIS